MNFDIKKFNGWMSNCVYTHIVIWILIKYYNIPLILITLYICVNYFCIAFFYTGPGDDNFVETNINTNCFKIVCSQTDKKGNYKKGRFC